MKLVVPQTRTHRNMDHADTILARMFPSCTMQLIPTGLHQEVPHEGGASKIRKQGGGCP